MRVLALVLAAVAASGCLGDSWSPPAGEPFPAGLQAGDWWDLEVTDLASGQAATTVRMVVAEATADGFLVGQREAFDPIVLLLPASPVGRVGSDLSWTFGEDRFQPIAWPLQAGTSWTTSLQGGQLDASIVAVEDGVAKVEMHGPRNDVYLSYDPASGLVVDYENDGWVSAKVLRHGKGFAGTALVPEYDHVVDVGRALGVLVPNGANPVFYDTVDVADGWQLLTLSSTAGALQAPDPVHDLQVPGSARERVESPDGQVFDTVGLPAQPMSVDVRTFEGPAGTWYFEHLTAGGSAAFTFGAAYNLWPAAVA